MVLVQDPFFNRSVATSVSNKLHRANSNETAPKIKTTTITNNPVKLYHSLSNDNDSSHTKRIKQAHKYINSLEMQQQKSHIHTRSSNISVDESIDDSERDIDAQTIDRSLIHERLQRDALSQYKKLYISFSDLLAQRQYNSMLLFKKISGMPLTSCSWSTPKTFYTCSKEGIVQEWIITSNSIEKSKRFQLPNKLKIPLYALAFSPNNEYVVAGGKDGILYIWNAQDGKLVKSLKHHKSRITGLSFRRPMPQSFNVFINQSLINQSDPMILYSCSDDRSVKLWDIDQLAYADTLFGHEDSIINIDSLSKERCVTCGSRDRSLHVWKIVESSQLVFKANDLESSIDAVAMLDEEHFISGSERGTLSIWHIGRKHPLVQKYNAHDYGITCIATIPMSDLVISGSHDGKIQIWRTSDRYSKLNLLFSINVQGFINSMSIIFCAESENSRQLGKGLLKLLICVSQEPRLGRWKVDKNVCNSILVYEWNLSE